MECHTAVNMYNPLTGTVYAPVVVLYDPPPKLYFRTLYITSVGEINVLSVVLYAINLGWMVEEPLVELITLPTILILSPAIYTSCLSVCIPEMSVVFVST